MAPIDGPTLRALEVYLQKHGGIKLYTPQSPDYDTIRECFVIRPARPFAIVRPQTAEDVQALMQFVLRTNVDFSIRSGGHDSAGRSQIDGGLMIDLRDLNYVHISEERTTATVGGGILLGSLAEFLGEQDLITPTGSVASVGYTGWSTLGGYGPFSSLYGLGVDQIVGAKLVNARGEIIEASEELLTGLRGGGGIFGIVVELTIKIYPLKQAEILASTLIYNSTDMFTTWNLWSEGYAKLQEEEGIPDALQLQQFAMEYPGFGKAFSIGATWVDENKTEGLRWIEKITGLAECVNASTQRLSMHQFAVNQEAVTPWPAYGRSHSVSLKEFTLKSLAILATYSSSIPGGGTGLAVHELRHPRQNEAVFGNQLHHYMVEILSMTTELEYFESGEQWGEGLRVDLIRGDPTNVLGGYIPLMDDDETNLRLVYGEHYNTLLGLKQKYDPRNRFHYAIPRLPV